MRPSFVRVAALLGALAVGAPALAAQSLREQTRALSTRTPTHIISVNPFLPLFGYFQAEYEQRVAPQASIAVSGSHTRLEHLYTSVDVKLRLYPQERPLEKLGISAGLGYGRVQRQEFVTCDPSAPPSCNDLNAAVSAPTFAVEAQYQWLLGARRYTAVAIGGGAKRFYLSEERAIGLSRVTPTLRLTIGYAF